MNPSDFLGAVCPDGLLVRATKVRAKDRKGKEFWAFHHKIAQGTAQLAQSITETAESNDTYYALASFAEGFHLNAKGKKVLRVRNNVSELKALWFDIDFKDGLEGQAAVVKALQSHCKATGLPAPSILVSSGNGIHAYWPLVDAIPVERWQVLADGFKDAAKKTGLQADLVCTADACRILRPPGTVNLKDPENPKPVKVLYSSGRLFKVEELESCISRSHSETPNILLNSLPEHLRRAGTSQTDSKEFTGAAASSGTTTIHSSFSNLVDHCGSMSHMLKTHGATASEPLWKDTLQLLSHCQDGEIYLHDVSDGHPEYSPQDTKDKWEQRKESDAGPTLCSTFEMHLPEICAVCPHRGKIKTPLHVGQVKSKPKTGMPLNYRVGPKAGGIQKLVIDDDGVKSWVTVLRHNIDNLKVTRSVQDGSRELSFEWSVTGGDAVKLEIPGSSLGNINKLRELTSHNGLFLVDREPVEFVRLMGLWLEQLQKNRLETKVTDQLGWIIETNAETLEEQIVGFSCGSESFLSDGSQENGVRVKREYETVAGYYEPKGSYDKWKDVANFITQQNYPAFTAVLATAFAAPLVRFTGEQGALVGLYSTESGVGKSSMMKIAQSVWGSPIHGINSVNDTRNSVTRKMGFINNLPAYWDELRGEGTMDDFCEMAFQITQGKEKTRLDSTARMRTSVSWCTMMTAASNDSIFDAMAQKYHDTDAGMARVFEIPMQAAASSMAPDKISKMIDKLQLNHGHAGRVYAKYLAENVKEVEQKYDEVSDMLVKMYKRTAVERYWFAAMTTMVTGAILAKRAGIVEIDVPKLIKYLGNILGRMRDRTKTEKSDNDVMGQVSQYYQAHADRVLMIKEFPHMSQNGAAYEPTIVSLPQTPKIILVRSELDKTLRFTKKDFTSWLHARGYKPAYVIRKLIHSHGAKEMKAQLALGTKFALPRTFLIEVPFDGE